MSAFSVFEKGNFEELLQRKFGRCKKNSREHPKVGFDVTELEIREL